MLEGHLKKQKESGAGGANGPWLVGGKYSFADFAFLPWQKILGGILEGDKGYSEDEYPLVKEWLAKIVARRAIKKIVTEVQPFYGRK